MKIEEIIEKEKEAYMPLFSRFPVCFTKGKGCVLVDESKKKYIDFFSGIAVNSLGYNNSTINKAIKKQAKKLIHTSNLYYTKPQLELAKALLTGTHFNKAFFCNSGLEANEAAIKLVRKYFYKKGQDKYKIVSLENSFHGRSLATATLSGQEKFHSIIKPLPEGFLYTPINNIEALKKTLDGDKKIGAVMLECVQGESGVFPCEREFLSEVQSECKARGLLLIIDEVQTGIGRCGEFYSYTHFGISPDIITLAKGLGGGLPIGAMLTTNAVAASFDAGDHGTTFGGNPLCCGVALAVASTIKKPLFLETVRRVGSYMQNCLHIIKQKLGGVAVRGLGLLCAVELKKEIAAKEIAQKMLEMGFVIGTAGRNSLRFAPPLTITQKQVDKMIKALQEVLA